MVTQNTTKKDDRKRGPVISITEYVQGGRFKSGGQKKDI